MPTLEDVFLNVASMQKGKSEAKHRKFSETNVNNDKILFEENFMGNYTSSQKFNIDLTNWTVTGVTNYTDAFKNSGLTSETFTKMVNNNPGWAALDKTTLAAP